MSEKTALTKTNLITFVASEIAARQIVKHTIGAVIPKESGAQKAANVVTQVVVTAYLVNVLYTSTSGWVQAVSQGVNQGLAKAKEKNGLSVE